MNIAEFNKIHDNRFRLKEYGKVTENFRYLVERISVESLSVVTLEEI